jgi:hypothetical protein
VWNCAAGAAIPFLLALILWTETAGVAPAASGTGSIHVPVAIGHVSPLAAGWSAGRAWSYVESVLSTRQRMLQLGILGMAIGLFILMRK